MHVEALGVRFAIGPGDDMRRTQQGRVRNTGKRTAAVPVLHERSAENVLADALHDQALHLRGGRQFGNGLAELFQRFVGEADAEPVRPLDAGVEARERGKYKGRDARRGGRRWSAEAQFGGDARMGGREIPGTLRRSAGQPRFPPGRSSRRSAARRRSRLSGHETRSRRPLLHLGAHYELWADSPALSRSVRRWRRRLQADRFSSPTASSRRPARTFNALRLVISLCQSFRFS